MQRAHEGLTGMILEDEPRFREFLADVLRDMGIDPLPASTAMSAMRMLEVSPPDLLLLDLNLPFVDGMSFLEKFRQGFPASPVLVISAFGDLDSARKAIHLGVTEFLTKPCDLDELEGAIARARELVLTRRALGAVQQGAPEEVGAELRPLTEVERDAILRALRQTEGNRSLAARQLGISRRALYNKLKAYESDGHAARRDG